MGNPSVMNFHFMRQIRDNFHTTFQRELHVTRDLVKRISLDSELQGHTGCVNCLQWNDRGDLLASGSDDLNINLWAPFRGRKLLTVQSGHHGNIFSVKFVPGTNDHCIVSGAADFKIRVNNYVSNEVTFTCSCHGGRVKRIATEPNAPQMFWSAAEDGMILQFDLRSPHQCSNVCKNVLVNLVNHLGKSAEAKCLAINPVNPDLVAVGANDPFIRIYDRRMIKTTTARFRRDHPSSPWDVDPFSGLTPEAGEDNLFPNCVTYFVAGHLPKIYEEYKKKHRTLTATYVTFSPDGKDVLANLGGEQVYLFNIKSKRKQMVFDMTEKAVNLLLASRKTCDESDMDCYDEQQESKIDGSTICACRCPEDCPHRNSRPDQMRDNSIISSTQELPEHVNEIKLAANKAFEKRKFTLAISFYSSAIHICPNAACLYANRAAAYLKRIWVGDYYAAIRDCCTALDLDPNYLKAHFRLAQCLHKLDWDKEAFDCLQAFKMKYPHHTGTKAYEAFENEVKTRMFSYMSKLDNNGKKREDTSSSSTASGSSFTPHAGSSSQPETSDISEQEKKWRESAYDFEYRYCGHCNTTTDIKEANFFGSYGEFIVGGSDDGSIMIWDRESTNILRILRGDDSIVNCLQPHPTTCMIATSGIDPVVRLWGPRAEDGSFDDREILDQEDVATANQRRMNADPLETMLINMGYRLPGVIDHESEDFDDDFGSDRNVVQCATS